LEGIYRLWR